MPPVPRQGWFFFQLNFKNGISQNTGKCELGGFSLRQSHMERMMPINRNLALVISFLQWFSGYEGASKAIRVHKQVTSAT